MDNRIEMYHANEDILCIMKNAKLIGWRSIKEQSIQRIMYLSKVLYSFTHSDDNKYDYYHFSIDLYGPFSALINNSIIFLKSSQYLVDNFEGKLEISRDNDSLVFDQDKDKWIKTIILILGKYGEHRIFAFTIYDPLYKEAVETNQLRVLDTSSVENKTIKVLKAFKKAFEETLKDTSTISAEEYLDLYFEYIFSQIIKN